MQTLRKGGEEMRLKDAGEIYGLVTLVIVLIGGLIVAFLENRVEGGLAPSPLPLHRTYGSVYGATLRHGFK